METTLSPSELKLRADRTAFLLIDVQDRLVKAMDEEHWQSAEKGICNLLHLAGLYDIPVFVTEQYPKGLGETVPAVQEALGDVSRLEKVEFSACAAPGFLETLQNSGLDTDETALVVCGMEAHVCVYQTVLDLLQLGYRVFVPRDGVLSRKSLDYETGLELMEKAGAIPTTAETVIFQVLEKAGTENFKAMSKRLK